MSTERKILVVDDDKKNLQIMDQLLKGEGFAPTILATAEEAFDTLQEDPHQFDVILADWELKRELDGDAILIMTQILFDEFKTPIIFLTAHTARISKYAMGLGAFDTIEKPATPEKILYTIDRALNKKAPGNPQSTDDLIDLKPSEIAKNVMAMRIMRSLRSNHGNLSSTAKEIGCSRQQLYRWLKKIGLYNILVNQRSELPRKIVNNCKDSQ